MTLFRTKNIYWVLLLSSLSSVAQSKSTATDQFLDALCDAEKLTLELAAKKIAVDYVIESAAITSSEKLLELVDKSAHSQECTAEDDFASLLTKYLRQISGDGHFYIEKTQRAEANDWISEWRASGSKKAQGIQRVEVLDGNIGFIQISSFFELEPALPFYKAAFNLVKDTDALILDLRNNGGGSSETAWPLQWSFLGPDQDLNMILNSRSLPEEKRAEPEVPWSGYGSERPLVILLNKHSFSAPESVAYSLQSIGRAIVIGERSGGGAHMLDEGYQLETGFTLYTPVKRPINLETNSNWEKTGVIPDIESSSEDAKKAGLAFLLEKIKGDRS